MKIYEKFKPHMTSYTVSDSADKSNPDDNIGGRPNKSKEDLKQSGQRTRNNGDNKNPKPSTKK